MKTFKKRFDSCIDRYNKIFCDDKIKKPTVDVMREISKTHFGNQKISDVYYKMSDGPNVRNYDNITSEELQNFENALDDLESRYG